MSELGLQLIVLAFAVVTGANDGATLVALNAANPAVRFATAVIVLSVFVAVAPMVTGTKVAQTIASGLAPTASTTGPGLVIAAVVASVSVVMVLSYGGLPTSLTLALVGALLGAGLGGGLVVSWPALAVVLTVGLLAPLASLLIGLLVTRALTVILLKARTQARSRLLRHAGLAAYGLQSLAYATNDGQKMLAVLALILGARLDADDDLRLLSSNALLSLAFAVGTLAGVERMAGRLNRKIIPVRPFDSVASETAAATAVLMSSAVGSPVSMTQASTAALVGTGIGRTRWRIRWDQAAHIAMAWFVTLPASAAAGALVGAFVRLAAR